MSSQLFSFLVQDVIQELPEVRRYRFDFGLIPFEFYAGQFCVVNLPGAEPPLTGALSLATSPLRRDGFDLVVKRTGNFGSRFYDSVNPGEMVTMKPPVGLFVLPINSPQPVTVIAFDYCVTAVRSFWQYLEDTQDPRSFQFIHVIRGPQHALFRQEFESSVSSSRNYLPCERAPDHFGITVNEVRELVPDLFGRQVFVVGEGRDVLPTVQDLKKAGLTKESLHMERWS